MFKALDIECNKDDCIDEFSTAAYNGIGQTSGNFQHGNDPGAVVVHAGQWGMTVGIVVSSNENDLILTSLPVLTSESDDNVLSRYLILNYCARI